MSTGFNFGTPAFNQAPQASNTAASAAPTFGTTGFGVGQSVSKASTLSFGFGNATSTANTAPASKPLFGGSTSTFPSTNTSLGGPSATQPPAVMPSFGAFGATSGVANNPIASSQPITSGFGTIPTVSTNKGLGLGGVSSLSSSASPSSVGLSTSVTNAATNNLISSVASTSNVNVAVGQPPQTIKHVKEDPLPVELQTTVDAFKNHVRNEKVTSSEISTYLTDSSIVDNSASLTSNLKQISKDIRALHSLVTQMQLDIVGQQKNFLVKALRADTLTVLSDLRSTATSGQTSLYFATLVVSFENKVAEYKEAMDEIERLMQVSEDTSKSRTELIVEAVSKLTETFSVLAARYQTIHEQIQSLKSAFISHRKRVKQQQNPSSLVDDVFSGATDTDDDISNLFSSLKEHTTPLSGRHGLSGGDGGRNDLTGPDPFQVPSVMDTNNLDLISGLSHSQLTAQLKSASNAYRMTHQQTQSVQGVFPQQQQQQNMSAFGTTGIFGASSSNMSSTFGSNSAFGKSTIGAPATNLFGGSQPQATNFSSFAPVSSSSNSFNIFGKRNKF